MDALSLPAVLPAALILASAAIIALAACLIPLAFQTRRQFVQLEITAERMKTSLDVLVHDSRGLMRNVDALATRVNQQMDDVNQVVSTVRQWTQRADQLVNEVSATMEPPAVSLVRNLNLLRVGTTAFVRCLLDRSFHNPDTEEKRHV